MRRLRAVARKEVVHLLRDPRSLIAALGLPVVLLLLYGYAVDVDLRHLALVAVDHDRSPASRRLTEACAAMPEVDYLGEIDSAARAEALFERRRARLVLVIPPRFEATVRAGGETAVQLLIDGTDGNIAATAQAYAEGALRQAIGRLVRDEARRRGVPERLLAGGLEVRPRVLYNPDLESRQFLIPGLVGIILMLLSALLTSGVVVRERERGSFELLAASPVSATELIVGKLLPYFVLAFVDVLVTILLGWWIFAVVPRGSLTLLFALSTFYILCALALGLLFSCLARTQQTAMTLAFMATMIPTMLLSGFSFPIRNMPWLLQQLAVAMPATHYLVIVRGVVLKGAGLEVLWRPALILTVTTLLLLTIAVRRFRKEL